MKSTGTPGKLVCKKFFNAYHVVVDEIHSFKTAKVRGTILERKSPQSLMFQVPSIHIYIYMGVVLNKSSQEPPFRKSFANLSPPFAVP